MRFCNLKCEKLWGAPKYIIFKYIGFTTKVYTKSYRRLIFLCLSFQQAQDHYFSLVLAVPIILKVMPKTRQIDFFKYFFICSLTLGANVAILLF